MSVQVSSGNTSVTGSVTSTEIERTGITAVSGSRITTGTTTIGTVPANKRWKIVGINHELSGVTTTAGKSEVQLNGVTYSTIYTIGTAGASSDKIRTISYPYDLAPILTAGQTVTLVMTTVTGAPTSADIIYIEEAV